MKWYPKKSHALYDTSYISPEVRGRGRHFGGRGSQGIGVSSSARVVGRFKLLEEARRGNG